MTTIIADTHKEIARLQTKGFSKHQAEGITDTLQGLDLSKVATKADISKVLKKIAKVQSKIVMWVTGLLIAQTALIVTVIQVIL